MVLSRRAKIVYVSFIAVALIFTIFGVIVLAQVYNTKNYPTELKNGNTFVYGYASSYRGSLLPSSYYISEASLTVSVVSINTNFINISVNNVFTFNGSLNSTTIYMLVSTQAADFPFFYLRDDAAARFPISSYTSYQPSGNYFGWTNNPRNYEVGYFVGAGNWYINSKTAVGVPGGFFGVYKLIDHNYQILGDILYDNMTTLYVEQLTGVIVKSDFYSIIKNITSGTELYEETESLNLLHTTTYLFPILSGIVIFLNFGDPIITFLTSYLIIITLIIAIIVAVYLWRRTSAFRSD